MRRCAHLSHELIYGSLAGIVQLSELNADLKSIHAIAHTGPDTTMATYQSATAIDADAEFNKAFLLDGDSYGQGNTQTTVGQIDSLTS